jgi:NAD(P)H dehydrogenase (quinone)
MSTVLVLYDPWTGNTKKMTPAVAEGAKQAKGVNVVLKKVDDASFDLKAADGIIVDSPTFYGLMSGKLKALFDKSIEIHGELEGIVRGAFTSSGAAASGAETVLLSILHSLLIHGMIVQSRHDHEHYGAAAVGAPNNKAFESCRQLGKKGCKSDIEAKIVRLGG